MRWYFAGMRSTWPYLAGVVSVGAFMGLAIGAYATSAPETVSIAPATPSSLIEEASITVPNGSATPLPTVSTPGSTVVPTLVATTTIPVATTTIPPTSTVETSIPPTSVEPVVPPTDSTPPIAAEPRARADVRLVVANGDGRYNLVGANVTRLEALGYVTIDQTDVDARFDATVVFFRPGFDAEAARLAADIQLPGAVLQPLGDQTITINDDLGDLIVVLGADAIR